MLPLSASKQAAEQALKKSKGYEKEAIKAQKKQQQLQILQLNYKSYPTYVELRKCIQKLQQLHDRLVSSKTQNADCLEENKTGTVSLFGLFSPQKSKTNIIGNPERDKIVEDIDELNQTLKSALYVYLLEIDKVLCCFYLLLFALYYCAFLMFVYFFF